MFDIKTIKFDNLNAVKLVNLNSGESISILPQFGANIYEIKLLKEDKIYNIIRGFKSESEIIDHEGFYSSQLFPFAGRLPDGKYSYENSEYQFDINDFDYNTALHGFLYNQKFEIISKNFNEEFAEISLSFNTKDVHNGYPFNVEIIVTYRLDIEGFFGTTKFINHGEKTAPIAYGIHTYFRFDNPVDDLEIKIPTEVETILSDRLVPSGKTKIKTDYIEFRKIGNSILDNGFQFPKKEDIVITQLKNPDENCIINLWQETGQNKFNFLQVYTPPKRDCIAIEPLAGNLNSLNSGDDLIELSPKESTSLSWGVKLT